MEIFINNILEDIKELSDLNLQRKLWLNENNDTGLISSYVEVMCRLFDDNKFDDFINLIAPKVGLSQELIFELNKLRYLLDNYTEKETDEQIINDPEWKIIVLQAKNVLKEWNNHNNFISKSQL